MDIPLCGAIRLLFCYTKHRINRRQLRVVRLFSAPSDGSFEMDASKAAALFVILVMCVFALGVYLAKHKDEGSNKSNNNWHPPLA
jgi:hypothetical protein